MMIGEATGIPPTVQIPSWDTLDDPTVTVSSPYSALNFNGGDYPHSPSLFLDSFKSLHRYLPSNEFATESDSLSGDEFSPDSVADVFSCDSFRMFEFKVRRCARGRSHDWTECPFAHPGEKARRRDPRKYHYSGTACPEFRKGSCRKGDTCEFSHGVFECWLHPTRYRTQPCKDGIGCRRRVCFFAHTPEQLRVLPVSLEPEVGCSVRHLLDSYITKSAAASFVTSPTSILVPSPVSPPSESPPMSPSGNDSFSSASELVASMRKIQLGNGTWGMQAGSVFGSPRCSMLRPGFCSSPSTPTRTPTRSGPGRLDLWDTTCEEEPVVERVESGKELRAKMYAKLSKENSLGRADYTASPPDVAWVSELVK